MKENAYTSILDIGCGNGRFLEQAKHMNLKMDEYHGVDSSGGMIKEAKKLHKTHNFTVFPMEMLENC
jgi:ubiquinone/menaquinone biosynthesis C-methylase UbiE